MKVFGLESSPTFVFYEKPSSASILPSFDAKPDWPCMGPGQVQSRFFMKIKTVGALFLKNVHVSP